MGANAVVFCKEMDKEILQKEISAYNSHTADYKRVEKIMITKTEFPKTTTRKIKRFVIKKEWAS